MVNIVTDRVLFDLGEATLRPQGARVLDAIAPALKDLPNEMVIEGHTDNLPISDARFASNWELSTQRATTVLRHLLTRGLAARKVAAAGYADQRPLDARTPAPRSRARNRRVAIVILSDAAGRSRVDGEPVLRQPAVRRCRVVPVPPAVPAAQPQPPYRVQEPDMPTATVTVTEVPAADVAAPPKVPQEAVPRHRPGRPAARRRRVLRQGPARRGPRRPSPTPRPSPARWRRSRRSRSTWPTGATSSSPSALQLSKAAGLEAGAVGEGAAVAPTVDGAKALDAAIDVLGRRTYAQLLATGGRASAQKALSTEVRKRYDGDVLRVYFGEFLMQ